jgi:hypothetical protein
MPSASSTITILARVLDDELVRHVVFVFEHVFRLLTAYLPVVLEESVRVSLIQGLAIPLGINPEQLRIPLVIVVLGYLSGEVLMSSPFVVPTPGTRVLVLIPYVTESTENVFVLAQPLMSLSLGIAVRTNPFLKGEVGAVLSEDPMALAL